MQTQNSAPIATAHGQNPGNSAPLDGWAGLSELARAVDQFESPTSPDTASAQTPPGVEPDPDPSQLPQGSEPSGEEPEEIVTEETPTGEEPAGEEQTDLSQSDPLNELDAETKARVHEIAKALKSGALKPGELPKIAKLVAQKHEVTEQIEALKNEIEELKSGAKAEPSAAQAGLPDMPGTVAKLKTPQEIEQREFRVQTVLDWCEENPEGGELNGQTFSMDDVKAMRRDARQELRWLPKRGAQLQQAAQFQQQQAQVRAAIVKEFPVLNDPENPDTKMARSLLKDPRFAGEVNAEYLALAMARGHRELQAESARRKAPPVARPTGAIPKAKPASGGGGGVVAAPRPGAARLAQAAERVEKERSVSSLADLISASR